MFEMLLKIEDDYISYIPFGKNYPQFITSARQTLGSKPVRFYNVKRMLVKLQTEIIKLIQK